ncbi:hypothetical protein ACIRPT_33225 [Streptomyces sp. NPDC101227]|uniref:hypothetical protein n=1 Tax=Streptomyces sp. NPDC101227 TaxID=3366136 RepID=UPI0038031830
MTPHLADDALARLSRPGAVPAQHQRHLDGCLDCRTRMAVWQGIGEAARADAVEQTVAVPSFDVLMGPALAEAGRHEAESATETGTAERPARRFAPRGFAQPWRLAGLLAVRQAALLPRIWAPASALGIVGAALLASTFTQERLALRVFGGVVVLLMLFGALLVASPRRDPRRELLFTLPVPPAAVFLARLTVVLCADVVLALACSALLDGPAWRTVVASWLGESLLAASLALALSVRFAPAVGAAAGGALWLLGLLSGPQGMFTTPLQNLTGSLLSTTPWTLLPALALLAWAAMAMRTAGGPAPSD